MLVLALDTATPAVTAGVVALPGPDSDPGLGPDGPGPDADPAPRLLAQRVRVDARAHAELLMPAVRDVLAEAGVAMRELDAVVCGSGPGPFTGLRVGMVTAAALCDALEIPGHPVVSLDAIAHRAGTGTPLLVATDARRREVYWARYDEAGERVEGPHVERPDAVPVDGVERAAGAAAGLLGLRIVAPEYPDPVALVAVVASRLRTGAAPDPLTPLYLRRPDASEPGPRKRVTPR